MRLQRITHDLGTNQKDRVWICSKKDLQIITTFSQNWELWICYDMGLPSVYFFPRRLGPGLSYPCLHIDWFYSNAVTSFISKLKRASDVCLQLQTGVVKIQMFVLSTCSDSFSQLRSRIKGFINGICITWRGCTEAGSPRKAQNLQESVNALLYPVWRTENKVPLDDINRILIIGETKILVFVLPSILEILG